jgi:hypothetical protein
MNIPRNTNETRYLGAILDQLESPISGSVDPATTDPAATDSTSSWNQNSLLRGLLQETLNENLDYIVNFINIVDSSTSSIVTSNGQTLIINAPTEGSSAFYELTDTDVFSIEITGTWVGTLQFEKGSISQDSIYVPLNVNVTGKEIVTNNTSSNGYFVGTGSGGGFIRVRASTLGSGTATIIINCK